MMSTVFTRRLTVLSCAVAIGLFAACVCGTAHATLLWYDGFSLTDGGGDYVVDTPLTYQENTPEVPADPEADPPVEYQPATYWPAQSGGSGTFFNNPWVTSWLGNDVVSPSLERSGQLIPSVGGHAGTPYQNFQQVGRAYREFSSPWGAFTDPDGTFYFGFLATWGTGPTLHHRAVEMYDTDPTNDDYRTFQLGFSEWTGLTTTLTMDVNGTTAALAENVNFFVDHGTTHFVVLKFDMSTTGDDVVSVYLDPVGTTEPAVPSAQITTAQFLASHMTATTQFTWGDASQLGTGFDELRVADTFADVAINTLPYSVWTPEPASASLFGLGLLGFIGLVRRSRR